MILNVTLMTHHHKRQLAVNKIIDGKSNDWIRLIRISDYNGTYDEIINVRAQMI